MSIEPVQARKYLTRSRAKAQDNSLADLKSSHQRRGQKEDVVRKTIAVADAGLSPPLHAALSTAKAVKVSRKTATPRMAEATAEVKTALKRNSARNGGVAKKVSTSKTSIAIATAKPSKQVTFSDDKENLVPLRRGYATTHHEADDTDELMSSMGALSVKPLRFPSSKPRLPSARITSSAFDPLPALSPSKARRPPRVLGTNDEEMEDELSSPMSPVLKLPAKPKRGGFVSRGLTEAPGAIGLRKPLDLSTTLLMSPAKRPRASSFSHVTRNTQLSKLNAGALDTVPRPSLASPARRPPYAAISGPGSPSKSDFRLGSGITLKIDVLNLSKPGVKSPPKRAKVQRFVKIDETEDELGMDLDDYMLGRSPSRFVKQDVGDQGSIRGFFVNRADTNQEKVEPDFSGPLNLFATFPIATSLEQNDATSGTKMEQRQAEYVETDEGIPMEYLEDAALLMSRVSPTAGRYAGRAEGGSCHDFFNPEGDGDELSNPQCTRTAFSPSLRMELQPKRKKLFPYTSSSRRWEDEIPIDPFLLTLGVPDNSLGVVESPGRKTTVPVKLYSIDDMVSEDGNSADQENHLLSTLGTSFENDNHFGSRSDRVGRVLAGAVVFVDVYTSEGADASSAFVEALRGLGAKVSKSWNWNPNSTGGPGEGERKVGITHVVFKDGSPRTLQKVKDSKGVVLCVGVGWVTSCEEEQVWIDESIYPVDLDHVPRGGHRRRKSMEPKSLTGIPINNWKPSCAPDNTITMYALPKAPKSASRKPAFPKIEKHRQDVEPNPLLMQNIFIARRKSMQFSPKIGSPLRRFATFTMD